MWVEVVLLRSLCWLSGWIQMEMMFSQFGDIEGGNQVLFSAVKPVFMPYGFNVCSVRVRVQWSTEDGLLEAGTCSHPQ
jgi:hypothetical protein